MIEHRPVHGFPAYRVRSDGVIQSNWSPRDASAAPGEVWRDRATGFNNAGYLMLVLCDGTGGRATKTVHRLVAEAFLPNPQGLPLVRHIDGCKTNNNVSNLAWGTYSENYQDSVAHGTSRKGKPGVAKPKGSAAHRAKFTDEQVLEIRSSTLSGAQLARALGVGKSTISRIRRGLAYAEARG